MRRVPAAAGWAAAAVPALRSCVETAAMHCCMEAVAMRNCINAASMRKCMETAAIHGCMEAASMRKCMETAAPRYCTEAMASWLPACGVGGRCGKTLALGDRRRCEADAATPAQAVGPWAWQSSWPTVWGMRHARSSSSFSGNGSSNDIGSSSSSSSSGNSRSSSGTSISGSIVSGNSAGLVGGVAASVGTQPHNNHAKDTCDGLNASHGFVKGGFDVSHFPPGGLWTWTR
eukprot:356096-Chlamydomonas_euryale.AAC.5